jgi:hypothetical protein
MDIKGFKAWAESKKLSTDGETGRNYSYTFYDSKTQAAWDSWQAKAQAVPEGFVLIKNDTKTVVAIERMVEQQVEASGMDSRRLERLDGWRIIEAAIEAQEQTKSTGSSSVENIHKAAELIWYDNGMINQFEPLRIKLDLLNKWLLKQDWHLVMMVDSELATLSEDDLTTVCCGEESEQERLASPAVNDFLGCIFNEEYEAQEQKG